MPPESPRLGASERRADRTYSQVAASRPPTPSRDAGADTTVGSIINNVFDTSSPSHDIPPVEGQRRRVTVEEVTDEDEGGPWTQVQRRRRRARSTGSMPAPRVPMNELRSRLTGAQ